MPHILVTGGTGTLGRLVVVRLRDAGCKVRVLSRRSRAAGEGIEFVTGDLATGEGSNPPWRGRDHRALRGQQQGRRG
jgi:nucleoside-diphosphate-sugar epimerase